MFLDYFFDFCDDWSGDVEGLVIVFVFMFVKDISVMILGMVFVLDDMFYYFCMLLEGVEVLKF